MSEEKLRILKMVESGIISADEAVRLIEALEKSSTASSETKTRSSTTKGSESPKGLGGLFEELEKFGQKMAGQRPKPETVTQSKEKLFEFMQSAVKRLKDADIPFVGKGIEFTHVFEEQSVQPTRLKLETANGSVTVRPWDGEGVKAECQVKVYGASTEEEAKELFIKNSIFYAREDKLSLSVGLKLMKTDITLFVPSAELEDVTVKLFNGAFDIRELKAEKLDVRSGNGKIELKNSRVAVIEAETGNGPIRLIDCEGERAELNTFNGAIHMVGIYRFADLQTFNGNILYDAKKDQAEAVRAESMTGNIELYSPQGLAVKGELRTTAGRLTLPETGMAHVSEKDERIQKSLAFESENLLDGRQLMIDAETKTGSITLRMSSLPQIPASNTEEGSFGDGI